MCKLILCISALVGKETEPWNLSYYIYSCIAELFQIIMPIQHQCTLHQIGSMSSGILYQKMIIDLCTWGLKVHGKYIVCLRYLLFLCYPVIPNTFKQSALGLSFSCKGEKVIVTILCNYCESHSGHQQLRFTRNYMGAWRTWRRPPTSSQLLDWSCRRTRRRRRIVTIVLSLQWSQNTILLFSTYYTKVLYLDLLWSVYPTWLTVLGHLN